MTAYDVYSTRARSHWIASPCVAVCAMDAASGLCTGCWRTLDEIAAWSTLDNPGKQAVWAHIHQRKLTQRQGGSAAAAS